MHPNHRPVRLSTLAICCTAVLTAVAAAPPVSGQLSRLGIAKLHVSIEPADLTLDVGGSGAFTIRLKGVASSDLSVPLTTAGPANVVKVPGRIVIRKGQSRATIKLRGEHPGGPVTVTATLPAAAGGAFASAQVTVQGLRFLFPGSRFTAVVGSCVCPVSLSAAAPQGGITVRFSQSGPTNIVSVPATVFFPAGTKQKTDFILQGLSVGGPVMLTATLPESVGGASAHMEVWVVPDW